ncbi:hypothetical protein Tco_0130148 [Tanacetum coccineum]
MHVTNVRFILYENQDIATQGVVNLRYSGYTAVMKVEEREDDKKVPPFFRLLLHKKTTSVLPNLKNELKIEGIGTPIRSLKNKKNDSEGNNTESKADDAINREVENYVLDLAESQLEASETKNESALKNCYLMLLLLSLKSRKLDSIAWW